MPAGMWWNILTITTCEGTQIFSLVHLPWQDSSTNKGADVWSGHDCLVADWLSIGNKKSRNIFLYTLPIFRYLPSPGTEKEPNRTKPKQIEWSTTKSADPSPWGLRLDILWVASKEIVVVSSGQGFFTIILRPICNGSSEKYSSQFGFISN